MASILAVVNRALPFATPGTPLLQDLVHLGAICFLLYFAPQIQDWLRRSGKPAAAVETTNQAQVEENEPEEQPEVAIDEGTNIEDDTHDERQAVPQIAAQPELQAQVEDDVDDDDEGDDDEAADDAAPRASGSAADRNVGAKKAKSLARKDQRRAYNEFMRSQGEAQRARDAEGAAEREAALEAEKKRRALAEAELAAKKAKEREQKREAEIAEREAEYRRRESAVAIVKADLLARNMSDLHKVAIQVGGDVDEEWVEKVINASGVIGRKDNLLTMITSTGWTARITEDDARMFYEQAALATDIGDEHGYMEDSSLSQMLVSVLSKPAVTADA